MKPNTPKQNTPLRTKRGSEKDAWTRLLVALAVALWPVPSAAQRLIPGDSIRVRPSQSIQPERSWPAERQGQPWTEATVLRVTSDTLWYRSGVGTSPISIDSAEIRRATHSNHRWAGLTIGGLAGGAIGALVAHSKYEPTYSYGSIGQGLSCAISGNCARPPLTETRGEATAAGALGGAILGGGLGYLVGKMFGQWETVSLDQLSVGAGQVSLGVRVRR